MARTGIEVGETYKVRSVGNRQAEVKVYGPTEDEDGAQVRTLVRTFTVSLHQAKADVDRAREVLKAAEGILLMIHPAMKDEEEKIVKKEEEEARATLDRIAKDREGEE